MDELLRLADVSTRSQASHYQLADISFSLGAGECHAVVGNFFSDVAAFWDILSGAVATSGEMALFGKRLEGPKRSIHHPDVHFVDNGGMLFLPYKVIDNIYMKQKSYYCPGRARRQKRYDALLQQFDLSIDPEVKTGDMTDEWQHMVALLRMYVETPKISVLYDTFSYLSASNTREKGIGILDRLKEENGSGVIYLTTRYEDALDVADQITVISSGAMTGRFTREEVREDLRPLLYCISGWSALQPRTPETSVRRMAKMLIDSRSVLESTSELKQALLYLTDSIKKAVGASVCTVVLLDSDGKNAMMMGDALPVDDEGRTDGLVARCIERMEITTRRDRAAQRTEIAVPVSLKEEPTGFVYTSIPQNVEDGEAVSILEMMSREVSIAIETSRLIGKSILLQESHHRIKNNLQIIINLLYIQKQSIIGQSGTDIGRTFDQVINQVKSIAVVHDLLSKDKLGKNTADLKSIIEQIVYFYDVGDIQFDLSLESISIPYNKASTISLLINEVIANSVKHAFPDQRSREIAVHCMDKGNGLAFTVRDNGVGFPAEDTGTGSGIGMNIITSMIRNLEGEISFGNDGGAVVEISIPRSGIYDVG